MKGSFHVVYVCDRKYRPYVEVSAASVKWSAEGEVEIHVIDVDDPKIAARLVEYPEYHGSRATFAKLLIPELLPGIDWALYLDGDTLALGDVREIFKCSDDSKFIVGSRDPADFNLGADIETPWLRSKGLPTFTHSPSASIPDTCIYFCAGVMLMNLKAMREQRIPEKCFAFFDKYGIPPLNEQTVLNYICQVDIEGQISRPISGIAILPPQWGVFSMCPGSVDFSQPAIIHYPQDLPWCRDKLNKLFHDFVWLWWHFAERVGCVEVKRCSGWRVKRFLYLWIKYCPWLVTWSQYLRNRLRPLRGLSHEERHIILSRWGEN